MPIVRCHIQDIEFDFPLPDGLGKAETLHRALLATKCIQITTILNEHGIRFTGFERSEDTTHCLAVECPDWMTCFDLLDVMHVIRKVTGVWFDAIDHGMVRGFSRIQQAEIAKEREMRHLKSGQQPSSS